MERFVDAYEAGDVDAIVALITGDAWLRMPPVPLEYRAEGPSASSWRWRGSGTAVGSGWCRAAPPASRRSARTCRAPVAGIVHASVLVAVPLAGDQIAAITRFDNSVPGRFRLPLTH